MENSNEVQNNEPKKKKGKLKWIVIVVVAIIIIGAIASNGSDESKKTSTSSSSDESKSSSSEEKVEYTSYSAQELVDDLKANSLNASDKYKDQYVEVTGVLSTVDSSGKYISISASTEDYSFVNIACYINDDAQKEEIKKLSTGDELTIKGKVTDVGEVLGYSIDMDKIN